MIYRLGDKLRRKTDFVRLCSDYLADARRYARWAHTGREDAEATQRRFSLLKGYHFVEKGLSLAAPRPGFGQQKIRVLTDKLTSMRATGRDNGTRSAATSSLRAYQVFGLEHGVSVGWLDDWLTSEHAPPAATGGTTTVSRNEVEAATRPVGPDFFTTRHSVRNFAPGEIPNSDIEAAVRLAQKSPSVCNRQGAKVYCFDDPMDALSHQAGNAGFGHLAAKGLVITADLQAFSSTGERHQAYVDGGLFAMSLVYALHSMGYGSCMLAWSVRAAREAEVLRLLDIPESEVIIMMLAVGILPDDLKVARAWRRPLEEVLTMR